VGIIGFRCNPAKEDCVIFAFHPIRRKNSPAKLRRRRKLPRQVALSDSSRRPLPNCKKEIDCISRYLAAELHGGALNAFENHLKACPDCAAFLRTYKATIDLSKKFLARPARRTRALKLSLTPARRRRLQARNFSKRVGI